MTRRVTIAVAAALLVLAAVVGVAVAQIGGGGGKASAPPPSEADALPPGLAGKPAPRIRLRERSGQLLDTAALRGTPYVVTFLYTRCPDVCPLIAEELHDAFTQLG